MVYAKNFPLKHILANGWMNKWGYTLSSNMDSCVPALLRIHAIENLCRTKNTEGSTENF